MSKYKEIAEDIRKGILDGRYNPNEQLPLEKEMCEYYDVSRITIKKAVDELVSEGLVVKRRGAGTFVKAFDNSDVEGFSMSKQFCGFTESYKDKKVESKIIKFEVVHPTEEIATKLKMTCDDFVYYIIRVRYADGEPHVVEYTHMPIGVIPGIKNDILHKSVYSYIENELSLKIKSAHKTIRAIEPSDSEKEYLEIDSKMPILEVEQVGFLDNGQPFEYSIAHHRGDKTEFRSVSFK
ncbi:MULTISPECIES: GntR family transcriptional regulator [Clostridium]|uniref:Transcriptional regulator, GntR family n=2 Tax=Clostridium butyricum TaxID=1492 RepID=C4IM39_CLOBU|nr:MULTISPECIES: GntR family transcriptional regulator [Clostridium]ETI88260.1 MAG: Transcriptional regulator [Clostridium butyricum DORA_1]ALP91453.1 GntR family transcriptional regulator [Clostridium butyricum]ALS17949.1 GntR family transcriptional regulator [Clostridium butyricum]ANF15074.1 GntR family transcriptional regulator [Clostridium butyricum]AOR95083.1 GntR family transcriptional regulator [Clostridium butyricum]